MAIILLFSVAAAALPRQVSQQMRPYSGIGVLILAAEQNPDHDARELLYLYEEPAVLRIGPLNRSQTPSYDWIFTRNESWLPLIVMARRGEWLRVAYDDAGRLGWLEPRQQGLFLPWNALLKGRFCRLLPGLRKQYYQLFRQPGIPPMIQPVWPKHSFKVLSLDGDWALVMPDQSVLGWLRWRDEDGRLLISVLMDSVTQIR